jgi:hypothetical protein
MPVELEPYEPLSESVLAEVEEERVGLERFVS